MPAATSIARNPASVVPPIVTAISRATPTGPRTNRFDRPITPDLNRPQTAVIRPVNHATRKAGPVAAAAAAVVDVVAEPPVSGCPANVMKRLRHPAAGLPATATNPVGRRKDERLASLARTNRSPRGTAGPPLRGRLNPAAKAAVARHAADAAAADAAKHRDHRRPANPAAAILPAGAAAAVVPGRTMIVPHRAFPVDGGMILCQSPAAMTRTTKASNFSAWRKRRGGNRSRGVSHAVGMRTTCWQKAASARCSTCPAGSRRLASSLPRTSMPEAAPVRTTIADGRASDSGNGLPAEQVRRKPLPEEQSAVERPPATSARWCGPAA